METIERIKRRVKNKDNIISLIIFFSMIIFFLLSIFKFENVALPVAMIMFSIIIIGVMLFSEANSDESETEEIINEDMRKIEEKESNEKIRYLERKIIKYKKSIIQDIAVVISVFMGFISWIIGKNWINNYEFYAIAFLLIVLLIVIMLLSEKYKEKMRDYYQIEVDLLKRK